MTHWRARPAWALVVTLLVAAGPLSAGAAARDGSLVDAVRRLDRSLAGALLEQGVDVNAAGPDGTTAIHWAAHHGDLGLATRLLEAGADAASTNRYGVTPMWLAAENGHAALVGALLRAGVDPNTGRGDSGETVLMVAARGGYVDVLQRLVAHDADVNAAERIREQTALMWAAAERHRGAVTLLTEAGADLEARSGIGMTALMFAIRAGAIDVTGALLDQGADLEATAPDGTTMLVLSMLNAHWELSAHLLDRGADPNRDDPLHGRPLQVLAFMRRAENRGLSAWLPRRPTGAIDSIELADLLLERGADINDRVDWANGRRFPPHMALGMFPGVSFAGASPFFIAAKQCDVELMTFLAANGADPTLPNTDGVPPLLAAAGLGFVIGESPGTPEEALAAVQLLRDLGDDVMAVATDAAARGWGGGSALHGAVIRGATGLVRWLIEEGVPLDQQMASGETALDLAEGSRLGIGYHVQPELAGIIREAMIARGLEVHDSSEREHHGPLAGRR